MKHMTWLLALAVGMMCGCDGGGSGGNSIAGSWGGTLTVSDRPDRPESALLILNLNGNTVSGTWDGTPINGTFDGTTLSFTEVPFTDSGVSYSDGKWTGTYDGTAIVNVSGSWTATYSGQAHTFTGTCPKLSRM